MSCSGESVTLNIKTWDFPSNGPMALFGQTFFETLYVILDFGSLQLGLAPLKQRLIASWELGAVHVARTGKRVSVLYDWYSCKCFRHWRGN